MEIIYSIALTKVKYPGKDVLTLAGSCLQEDNRRGKNRLIQPAMDVINQFTGFVSTIPPVVQVLLIVLCAYIIRKLLKPRVTEKDDLEAERRFSLPPMKKRDFTVKELLEFDGIKNERVLLAVCGKVFDVTKGKSFYGPGLI